MDGHASSDSEDEPAHDDNDDGEDDDDEGQDEGQDENDEEQGGGDADVTDSDCDKTTLVLGEEGDVADLNDVDGAASEDDSEGGDDPPCVLSGRATLCSGPNCKICLGINDGILDTPPPLTKRSLEDQLEATWF